MVKAYMNWSGGKDSALCLHRVLLQKHYDVTALLTSVNEQFDRVSMHGVRATLLEQQAASIGIPLKKLLMPEMPSMADYERLMEQSVAELKTTDATHAIFGDIFLEDLRQYRIIQLQKVKMEAVFPLWKIDTAQLVKEFIAAGFKAIIVCVNEKQLDKSFCGRLLDESFLRDLPAHVDPCGENGEYHSFVFDGPIFNASIKFEKGEVVYRNYKQVEGDNDTHNQTPAYDTGFYYCDLLPI